MKLSLNWLRDFVDVDLPVAELASRLIDATAEVEGWETIGANWDPERIRVAEVVEVAPHPNADRLRLVTVDDGKGRQQVVCGAPNVAVGQKIAFATEGAELIDGHTGERARLKLRPIRGVDSAGMVLSEKELGLSDDHEGILVLSPDAVPGRPLVEQLGDVVFDISTWANRADLLGVMGFGRETAAITGKPLREPSTAHNESARKASEFVEVSIEAPDLCPRYTASVIENVTIGPSPAWMQERLIRAGQRPINNVVDITNYVMLETGQPLHAFDYDFVRGKRIVVRRAEEGERLLTLDGIERVFDSEMLLICDGEGPVAVGGVKGGGNSEVTESTRTILLEAANFRAGGVRRTSSYLKLRTEASLRFEKGLGPEIPMYAQHRALHLFEQLAGGTPAAGIVDVYPGAKPPRTIAVTAARIEQVLGIAVPAEDVRRILAALGFGVEENTPGQYSVQPPDWRPDVEIADDVIEDIGRIHGYHRLPTTMLRGQLPEPERDPVRDLRERLRDLAVTLGFQETISYTLTDRARLARMVPDSDSLRSGPLGVVNPVAAQHTFLRTSLRPSVLETYAANRHHEAGALRIFEVGFEYLPVEGDLPHHRPVLCAVLGGLREGRWPQAGTERLDFYDARGVAEAALQRLGIPVNFAAVSEFGLLPGHTAEIRVGKDPVGILGQVHPDNAALFDLTEPVFLVEFWVESLARHLPERPAYTAPSRFPEVRQDLALVLDSETPAGRVLELVRSHRSGQVRIGADIFDEYRGPGVPTGKKSLAIAMRFQSSERTLTDADVARVQSGLVTRLAKEFGATVRGG